MGIPQAIGGKMRRFIGWICLVGLAGCATSGPKARHSINQDGTLVSTAPQSALDPESNEKANEKKTIVATVREKLPWRRARAPISESTLNLMADYIAKNDLQRVHLEFQTETPGGDWQRLKSNNLVHPAFKYSAGSLGLVESGIIRGSFWGQNRYSPFTDTLHINSDDPVGILSELANAKVLRDQKHPGTYAFISKAPVLSAWNNSKKTSEMIAYARSRSDWELEKSTYRKMYPGIFGGTSVIAAAFVPFYAAPLLDLGVAGAGLALAEWQISLREKEIHLADKKEPESVIQPAAYRAVNDPLVNSK